MKAVFELDESSRQWMPAAAAHSRISVRVEDKRGRIKLSAVMARMPAKPVRPEPRNRRNKTVSA